MLPTSLVLASDAEVDDPFVRVLDALERLHPVEFLRRSFVRTSAVFVRDTGEELLRWPASRKAHRCGACRITAIA